MPNPRTQAGRSAGWAFFWLLLPVWVRGAPAPHPRLFIGQGALQGLASPSELPLLRSAQAELVREADSYLQSPQIDFQPQAFNSLLIRARLAQCRVETLLARWFQTGDVRYRAAALDVVREIGRWEYWGWNSWRAHDPRPESEFDLSYGENSLTLALAYDWLYPTLSPAERHEFVALAVKRAFRPYLAQVTGATKPFWFKQPNMNWNAVCSGGVGTLALAMLEDAPEAAEVLQAAQGSITPFCEEVDRNQGAWAEGIGYWNYAMRYAFAYLLSRETALGRPEPLLALKGMRATLGFPLDFCPHGQPCGFGDHNGWRPYAFHYAALARFGDQARGGALDAMLGEDFHPAKDDGPWPEAAELLLCHGREAQPPPVAEQAITRLYPAIGWGLIADRWPDSHLALTVRGGSTLAPHSQLDLLSFHCVVDDEVLVTNVGPAMYLDTTFGPRRNELYEIGPVSKNTLFIDGIGIVDRATVAVAPLLGPGVHGFSLDATAAMGTDAAGALRAKFCGRAILLLDNDCALIVDRVELAHPGFVESRLHTEATVDASGTSAWLRGKRRSLQASFAADPRAGLETTADPVTNPRPGIKPHMLRWITAQRADRVTLAVGLSPRGAGPVEVHAQPDGRTEIVLGNRRVELSDRLALLGPPLP